MKKSIKILDCTLRDGVRVINCAVNDNVISSICYGLNQSGADIIEIGTLRNESDYYGNSTIFTDIDQMRAFVPPNQNASFIAFTDCDRYNFSELKEYDGETINGIRVGFRKSNIRSAGDIKNVLEVMNHVKSQGYQLYIQVVNTMNYTDKEYLLALELVNEANPHSFGIVDTFGSMYNDDLQKFFILVDSNLNRNIAIDFHSHNNYQLSFSLAQELIRINEGKRDLILDSTLSGMGKGAGNLSTELFADYLNKKHFASYDFDAMLDLVDEYINPIKKEYAWGYSTSYMMQAAYRTHANNIAHLLEKYKLNTNEIKYIISMMDIDDRERFDYALIEKLYIEYNSSIIDDSLSMKTLAEVIRNKKVLVLAPGASLKTYNEAIDDFIRNENPVVFSSNFVYAHADPFYAFFTNSKRYKLYENKRDGANVISTSNIKNVIKSDIRINYSKLIECKWKFFDNAIIMLLRFLKELEVSKLFIAGLDGFGEDVPNYYEEQLDLKRTREENRLINKETMDMLEEYEKQLEDGVSVHFITPSRYAGIFSERVL